MNDPQGLHRSIFSMDNIYVLRAMNSQSVDLIYLDPPFNSNKTYSAPIGSKAAGAAFKDAWTLSDVDLLDHNRLKVENPALYALIHSAGEAHSKGMFSYLMMMAPRLIEMRRILKTTGSIYLHCDDTASHYLKTLMDAIFGEKNFRNDVIWRYGGSARGAKAIAKHFARNNDNLLYYAKDKKKSDHKPVYGERTYPKNKLPSHIRFLDGKYFKTAPRGDYTDVSIEKLRKEGRVYETKSGNIRIKYFLTSDDAVVKEPTLVGSVWDIPDMMHAPARERVGYPTQKPLALLERIIKASSNEGDLVLDPFCGCATTCVAAEHLGRKWVGIDLSELAAKLVVQRIKEKRNLFSFQDIHHRTTIPVRTDIKRRMANTPKERSELKRLLFIEQEGRCNLCHHEFPELRHFHMDHIFPQAKGGQDWEDNFQLLCGSCNGIKMTGTQEEAKARLTEKQGIDFTPFDSRTKPQHGSFSEKEVAQKVLATLLAGMKGGKSFADLSEDLMSKAAEGELPYGSKKKRTQSD